MLDATIDDAVFAPIESHTIDPTLEATVEIVDSVESSKTSETIDDEATVDIVDSVETNSTGLVTSSRTPIVPFAIPVEILNERYLHEIDAESVDTDDGANVSIVESIRLDAPAFQDTVTSIIDDSKSAREETRSHASLRSKQKDGDMSSAVSSVKSKKAFMAMI